MKNIQIIFDFDGVILNSHIIKAKAFYEIFKIFGKAKAKKAQNYHLSKAGISRYKKFNYINSELIQNIFKSDNENSIISLFNNYKNSRVIKNVGSENVTKESYIVNPYQLKYLLKSLVNNLKIRFANHSKEVYKVSKNKL